MRIERISWHPRALPRKERFETARDVSEVANVVFVRLETDGAEGWGASSPSSVTGESTETVVSALTRLSGRLPGLEVADPRDLAARLDAIIDGNAAAKAAIDIAAFDAAAKAKGIPAHEYLGSERKAVITDRTVGLMSVEDAVAQARAFVRQGFRALKVKLGGNAKEDLERMTAIREAVGNHILLRVDANQAFRYRKAIQFSRQAYPLVLEFFEQPLPADDFEGMQRLTEASPIPIMADESVRTVQDASRFAWEKGARLVNLKLMKTGGLARALEANAVCESAHVPTMVGCNAESQLSIAAGLQLALCQRNVRFADLDSHFNLAEDPATGLVFEEGFLKPSGKPGLGVDVRL